MLSVRLDTFRNMLFRLRATVSFRHTKGAGEGRSGVTPSGESHFAVRTVFERDFSCYV